MGSGRCRRAAAVTALVMLLAAGISGCGPASSQPSAAVPAEAEAHWLAACKSLDTIQAVSDRVSGTDPARADSVMPELASSLESMATTASAELDGCERGIASLPDGPTKSAYAGGIAAARAAVAEATAAAPILRALPGLWSKSDKLANALQDARDNVTSSTASPTASRSRALANIAVRDCAIAARLLTGLKTDLATLPSGFDGGGLEQTALWTKRETDLAHAALAVAVADMSGSSSRSVAARAIYENAAAAANTNTVMPDMIGTPGFFRDRAQRVLAAAVKTFADAKALHNSGVLGTPPAK